MSDYYAFFLLLCHFIECIEYSSRLITACHIILYELSFWFPIFWECIWHRRAVELTGPFNRNRGLVISHCRWYTTSNTFYWPVLSERSGGEPLESALSQYQTKTSNGSKCSHRACQRDHSHIKTFPVGCTREEKSKKNKGEKNRALRRVGFVGNVRPNDQFSSCLVRDVIVHFYC